MSKPTAKASPPATNRRRYERYVAIFGSDVHSKDIEARLGLTQDVSCGGARILTLAPYGIQKNVRLRIIVDDYSVLECSAKILREKEVADRGMWRYEIAVEFDALLGERQVSKLREISKSREF